MATGSMVNDMKEFYAFIAKIPTQGHRLCCVVFAGLAGMLPFFKSPEEPDAAMKRFLDLFKAQDAAAIHKIVHPEIVSQKELRVSDVEAFLKRFRSNTLAVERAQVDRRFKSEDGETERFQATILFRGPVLSERYPNPSLLSMSLLWIFEENAWWLERPMDIHYVVTVKSPYPSAEQQDLALRLDAALGVLDKLGLSGPDDPELLPPMSAGSAVEEYKELEKLYFQERGHQGVDPEGRGVQVFLEAAARSQAGFLSLYQPDFDTDSDKKRRSPPWDMYRDYAQASVKLARSLEAKKKLKRAQSIYLKLIALGKQLISESGGYQFVTWGITFQKQGAEELARLLKSTQGAQADKAMEYARLSSRRLDLLQTALSCVDDMTDYRSLQAAITAANHSPATVFRSWGVNTLAILALKGAPANRETIRDAGVMVIVDNPIMRQEAWKALEEIASEPSGRMKSFVDKQKNWISGNEVYGTVRDFR